MAKKGNHARRSGSPAASKLILLACVVLVLIVAGSALFGGDNSPVSDTVPPSTETAVPANGQNTQTPNVDGTAGAEPTSAPSEPPAQASQSPGTVPSKNPGGLQERASDIGRSIAVPESAAVDDSYFDDAIFIGDSRTEGLKMYSGLPVSCFWSKVGLTVETAFTDQFVVVDGSWLTVAQALERASYGKVYIMLGMNELGWVYESKFADEYARLIDVIQSSHPDAKIYVQSIIPVSKWLDSNPEQNRGYNTMANVIRLQKALVGMVESKEGVNYVNVAECMEDADGYLFSDSTQDGLHLNSEYCKTWMQYLRTHTV